MNIFRYLIACLLVTQSIHTFTNKSFLTYRSQGVNLARNTSGWLRNCEQDNISAAVEYTRSFDNSAINDYFFGGNSLSFSGSRVENRNECDILADYFGLPTDFQSCITFCPEIKNIIADFDFYWNLPCNFNLRINVPLAHTKWRLNPYETVIEAGTTDHPAGYMSRNKIERADLLNGGLDVLMCGEQFGDLIQPLQHGRLCCQEELTKFADVFVSLGYNVCCNEKWYFSLGGQVVIPTGTRSHTCILFEPQVGNGHHWGLGGNISARYNLFTQQDKAYDVSFCLDAHIQHLFKTTQKRSYDLKDNCPGNRYMLIQDITGSVTRNQGFSPTPLVETMNNQYIGRLLYVIDATTLDSTIKIDVQADVVAQLKMSYCNFNCNIGYNFWARSAEKLVHRECFDHKFYGIKGDAQIYGYLNIGFAELSLPLNATQSKATLRTPQGDGNTTNNFTNTNADNAELMFNVGMPVAQTNVDSTTNTGITSIAQVNGANQAILLTDCDIDNCSGLSPRAISHKVFGSLGYQFNSCSMFDCFEFNPYFSVGAEGEFAGTNDCVKTAISQWGVWVKLGFNC